jgi:rhomboid protease GluP
MSAGCCAARCWPRCWRGPGPATRSRRPCAAGLVGLALLTSAVAALVTHIPAPSYRMGDELRAQAAIRKFLLEDQMLSRRWASLLDASQREGMSFEQLAGAIDERVTAEYQENFEELAGVALGAGAPSARTLELLRQYANLRSDASHALAEGLRARDPEKIRRALEDARRAPLLAQRALAPASAASAPASAPRR